MDTTSTPDPIVDQMWDELGDSLSVEIAWALINYARENGINLQIYQDLSGMTLEVL